MPNTGGPGQQAIPNAMRAMPKTRATGMAMPTSVSPSSNCAATDGTISNAQPSRSFADRSEYQHARHGLVD